MITDKIAKKLRKLKTQLDKIEEKEDDGSFTFGDRTMIPMSCIKKITKLN